MGQQSGVTLLSFEPLKDEQASAAPELIAFEPFAPESKTPAPVSNLRSLTRPAPMHGEGFTVPGSVRVTEPPAVTAWTPQPGDVDLPRESPTLPTRQTATRSGPLARPSGVTLESFTPETAPTTMSDAGLDTLKEREGGFYDTPYQDHGGLAVGYGMQTWKGQRVTPELRVTKDEADAEMRRMVDTVYGPMVRDTLKAPVSQAQFDALVSVAYNSPAAAVHLAQRLNRGEELTEKDFKASGTVAGKPTPGLQGRRGEEFTQFSTPPAPPTPGGPLTAGNIDLVAQPRVKNPDGTVSTVRSMSIGVDGKEVLIPTVAADGSRILSDEDAIAQYQRTGKHLGIFATPEDATAFAEQLHKDYAAGKYDTPSRPEPIHAGEAGVVVPGSVHITEPTGAAVRLGSAKTGGAAVEPPFGKGVIDMPAVGALQMAQGAKALAALLSQPTVQTGRLASAKTGGRASVPRDPDAEMNAASDILEGAMKVGLPLVIAGAIADLPGTIIALATTSAVSAGAGKVAQVAGASPAGQRYVSALAAASSAVIGSQEVIASAKSGVSSSARALALAAHLAGQAGKASGEAFGYRRPVAGGATVAEAVAPAVRPTAHAPTEIIEQGGIPSMPTPEAGETVGQVVSGARDTSALPYWAEGEGRTPAAATPTLESFTPAPVDEAGRSLGGYTGPERRVTTTAPPEGVEERRKLPAEQVRADLRDNPDLVRQADEMRRRAEAARAAAPVEEDLQPGDELPANIKDWPDDAVRSELIHADGQLNFLQKQKYTTAEVIDQAYENLKFFRDELDRRGIELEPQAALQGQGVQGAVPKQGRNAVDVQEPPGTGEAVGGGNAEHPQPAGAGAPQAAAPHETDKQTALRERAAAAMRDATHVNVGDGWQAVDEVRDKHTLAVNALTTGRIDGKPIEVTRVMPIGDESYTVVQYRFAATGDKKAGKTQKVTIRHSDATDQPPETMQQQARRELQAEWDTELPARQRMAERAPDAPEHYSAPALAALTEDQLDRLGDAVQQRSRLASGVGWDKHEGNSDVQKWEARRDAIGDEHRRRYQARKDARPVLTIKGPFDPLDYYAGQSLSEKGTVARLIEHNGQRYVYPGGGSGNGFVTVIRAVPLADWSGPKPQTYKEHSAELSRATARYESHLLTDEQYTEMLRIERSRGRYEALVFTHKGKPWVLTGEEFAVRDNLKQRGHLPPTEKPKLERSEQEQADINEEFLNIAREGLFDEHEPPENARPSNAWIRAQETKDLDGLLNAYEQVPGTLDPDHEGVVHEIVRELARREGQQELEFEPTVLGPAPRATREAVNPGVAINDAGDVVEPVIEQRPDGSQVVTTRPVLPSMPEGRSVEEGHEPESSPVAGGRTARPGHVGEPAGGDRGAGTEGVAGEQPAPPTGVSEEPAKQARDRKRRAGSRRGAARGGAEGAGAGAEPRGGEGLDGVSHVDTADLADSQDVADAAARGEAPRWFTIATAQDLTEGGGWVGKLDDNLAALRLLKQLEREGRPASDAEQAVLARYIGWGHTELAPVVDLRDEPNLSDPRKQQARQELEALLTAAELKELGESTANAHYSFADLPRAMWALAQRLGFKGGSVLEPAIGTGHFIGTMPGSVRTHPRTKVYGVDKEPIAAAIARQLYQGAYVQASPLEEAVLPENYFDLIISNVPFGKIGIFDPAFVSPEKTPMTKSVHNYYFGKAIDLARPGGLMIFVTSRYTMDSQLDVARRYIAGRADFLGAFRLPDQAFRKTAGTDVVTDVIVLQKRAEGAGPRHAANWLETEQREDLGSVYVQGRGNTFVRTNTYFVEYPDHVLGKEARTGKMKGQIKGYNVEGSVTPEQLASAVDLFPEGVYKPSKTAPRRVASTAAKDTKQGAFIVDKGKLFVYDKGTLSPSPLKGVSLDRAKSFVPLRDAYQGVIDAMLAHASDADLTNAQQAMTTAYKAFVRKHGHVNLRENKRVIDADPNASRVLALENIDILKGEKGKPSTIVVTGLADIFSKRLMRPPKEPTQAANVDDALSASIAWRGTVDLPYIEALTGKPATTIATELAGRIYQDPATKTWVTKADYLSGDVVTKLAQAEAAAKVNATFAANRDALAKVQPPLITIDDFTGDPRTARSAPFGATWVPVPLLERFLKENGAGDNVAIRLLNTKTKVEWYVEGWGRHEFLPSQYEYAAWVAEALNGELPTVRDSEGAVDPEATERYRQSLGQLREQWATWWKADPEASEQIVRIYNAMFNREVGRTFDGSTLVLPNSNPEIVLRAGQKDSVVGALERGNTLFAQAVGWGKTFEMIAVAGEWKRRGLAGKPLIVVPNHIVEQWRRAFIAFYPSARVLLPEKRDFDTGNRKRLIARIANNDWDAVVLGASQFLRIGVRLDTLKAFFGEQEAQLLAEGAAELHMTVEQFSDTVDKYGNDDKDAKRLIGGRGVPRSVKDVARAILNMRKRLKKRTDQQAKDPINFEDLGVDGLIVDEAHMFKNLYFYTGKNDVVGLKGSDADQALDMFLKVRHINQTSNNRNLVFATGTPITNTMSELYTMFRYLAQPTLDRLGMAGFDSWANAYAAAVGSMEPAPEGGYKERTRLSEWMNLGELSSMFRRFADVVTTEDILKENARLEAAGEAPLLKLPKAKKVTIQLEPHSQFADFMLDLKSRVAEIRAGEPRIIGTHKNTGEPILDNFLTVTTSAGLAAIDMRLVSRHAEDEPTGRLRRAASEIAQRYKASDAIKGTQIVFLDVGVPKGKDIPPLPSSIAGPATKMEEPADEGEEETSTDIVDEEAEGEAALDGIRNVGEDKNLYGELKRLLVAEGLHPNEIAFIHQATNPSEQHRLFAAVREGRVRVLLSTRAKGGTGMNVQDRVVALHHVDVPWRPDQMEQAEGRAIRQGNMNAEVDIVRYVTKQSFDEYRWYLLSKKQGFISSFYRGDLTNMEDVDTTQLDMQVAAALASGDPRVLQMIQVERALVGLRARYENFSRRRGQAERDLRWAEKAIEDAKARIKILRPLGEQLSAWKQEPTVVLDKKPGRYYGYDAAPAQTFDFKDTDSRKALREALVPLMKVEHVTDTPIGHAGPFILSRHTVESEAAEVTASGDIIRSVARSAPVLTVKLPVGSEEAVVGTTREWTPDSNVDLVRSLDHLFDVKFALDAIATNERRLANNERDAAAARTILTKQFEQTDELKAKQAELAELRVALGVEKAKAAAEQPPKENAILPAPARAEHAIVPMPQAARDLTVASRQIVDSLTAPNVTPGARVSARYFRYRLAQMVHTVTYAREALATYRDAVERLTVDHEEILKLADILEGKSDARMPAALRPWLAIRNQVFGFLKRQIAALGIEKQWKEYYLGHVWETEFEETGQQNLIHRLMGRRPLQGPKGFLRRQTIPSLREGVEGTHDGIQRTPKTWNLVDIDLYKMEEMAKFVLGRVTLEDNKRLGTWRFVSALSKPPKDLVEIPDPIGKVWAPPQITVHEAFDQLLTEGLENFIGTLGVNYRREANTSIWGRTNAATGAITMKVGAPEFALMHEIGHAIDARYGLYRRIADTLKTPEFEGDKSALGQLKALAAMRYEGMPQPPAGTPQRDAWDRYKRYTEKHPELIANLVHAYLWAPEKAKQVAPDAYDALDDLVLRMPELAPLQELQQMRGLVFGEREAQYRLPGPMLLGRYYAAPEVARLFKNYLTPGLSANKMWALVRIPANALTQVKLAFSAFHAFTITQESAAMEAARGIADVARGKPSGLRRAGTALVEPAAVVGRGLGHKKEYLGTLDPMTLAVDSATNLLLMGGGRVEQSREYSNRSIRKFADNLRRANEAYIRGLHGRAGTETMAAALHALPALVEAASWPILQWLVPAAKAGATVEQIRHEIAKLPGEPTEETLLAIASKAVNLSDATLGEVIWDNYFLPRAFMSVIHMLIMAPGWRAGSAILLGRGLTDPLRRLLPSQREDYKVRVPIAGGSGRGPEPPDDVDEEGTPIAPPPMQTITVKEGYWSPYTSVAIATVLVQVLVSELYQLAHGAGHVHSILDVAYPRTGEKDSSGKPERVRLPGYAGIFYDILHRFPGSFIEYAMGGDAPLPTVIGQTWQNESFGNEVIDHDDPWAVQARDYLKFLAKQWAPISVTSFGRRAGTALEKVESLAGISPAPARVTRTDLEEYLHAVAPPTHRSKAQAERAEQRQELRQAARETAPGTKRPSTPIEHLSPQDIARTLKTAKTPGYVFTLRGLDFQQALKAYTLATPEERLNIRATVANKLPGALARTPKADRPALMARFREAMALPAAAKKAAGF